MANVLTTLLKNVYEQSRYQRKTWASSLTRVIQVYRTSIHSVLPVYGRKPALLVKSTKRKVKAISLDRDGFMTSQQKNHDSLFCM